jgi:hypothetical protein
LSSAQTYNIESLNGKAEQITVTPDYPNNTLTILSSNDAIHISDFTDIKSVTVLGEHFLKIDYSVRGGSDENVQYLLLISIMDNKIYQSAHFPSLLKYDVNTVYDKKADSLKLFDEYGDYGVDVDIVGDNKENYKLVVNLHDEVKSKHDPKTNRNDKEQVSLTFDPNNYIFYNAHEDISHYFTVYDPKIQRAIKQYVLGSFPVIQFGNHKYYYIKDEWYGKGHSDTLLKYAYK